MSQSPAQTPTSQDDDGISIRAYRSDLRAINQSGLRLSNFFGSRRIFRRSKQVKVESLPKKVSETILYAKPPTAQSDPDTLVPTEHIGFRLDENDDLLVRRDDEFEIKFIGFSATPKDFTAWNANEIFMYSLARESDVQGDTSAATEQQSARNLSQLVKGLPSGNDSVTIHYDSVRDSRNEGTQPDLYIPIPASKSIYRRFAENYGEKMPCEVNVRFTMMEVDKVTDLHARTVAGFDKVGMYVTNTTAAVPYAELFPRAFALASAAVRKGLQKYAMPDLVLSKDIQFLLAPSTHESKDDNSKQGRAWGKGCDYTPDGDYLRYGYYFFLSKSCEARLYAQTGSSTQRVPLFMKRKEDCVAENERAFFPLTGFSYVVMKVSRGCSSKWNTLNMKRDREEDRNRVESILNMSSALEMVSRMNGQQTKAPRAR